MENPCGESGELCQFRCGAKSALEFDVAGKETDRALDRVLGVVPRFVFEVVVEFLAEPGDVVLEFGNVGAFEFGGVLGKCTVRFLVEAPAPA